MKSSIVATKNVSRYLIVVPFIEKIVIEVDGDSAVFIRDETELFRIPIHNDLLKVIDKFGILIDDEFERCDIVTVCKKRPKLIQNKQVCELLKLCDGNWAAYHQIYWTLNSILKDFKK
jgi:hypothetical protein